jgi:hypothetical protein
MPDVVSHGAMGLILAAPFLEGAPVAAAALALGSVLGDLEALTRRCGRHTVILHA